MKIRKARLEDLDIIMDAYRYAREFMQKTGNANQWIDGYPARELIVKDITDRNCYVCVDPVFGIAGVFYFRIGEDRTYARIEEGHWLNEEPYGVVHRIATNGKVRGVADHCLHWCFRQCGNMRIDTHRDNRVMQHILEKNGYTACGIIYTDNGTERIAFQKIEVRR